MLPLKWASNGATASAKHILMTTPSVQVMGRIFPPSCDPCAAGMKLYDLHSLSALGGSRNHFHFQSEITRQRKLLLTVQHLPACPEVSPSQRLHDLRERRERCSVRTCTCPRSVRGSGAPRRWVPPRPTNQAGEREAGSPSVWNSRCRRAGGWLGNVCPVRPVPKAGASENVGGLGGPQWAPGLLASR